jgi:hypothetical protein
MECRDRQLRQGQLRGEGEGIGERIWGSNFPVLWTTSELECRHCTSREGALAAAHEHRPMPVDNR